ncbi:MFS transporter [Caldisphaera lagunensis]
MLLSLGEFFDLYDLFAGGFTVTPIHLYYHVGIESAIFYTIAIFFLGAFVGVILLGYIGDLLGRRTVIVINMIIMSIAYLLTPFSPNIYVLGALRFIAGLGAGPEAILVVDIMSTEFYPAAIRGNRLAIAYTIAWISPIIVALISLFTIPSHWQWIYWVGGIGILTIIPLRFMIPESPRWLEVHNKYDEADKIVSQFEQQAIKEGKKLPEPVEVEVIKTEKVPLSEAFKGVYLKRMVMLLIFQFFQAAVYYGFTSLAPTVLYSKGFTFAKSTTMTFVIYTGYFIGSLLSIFLIDKKVFDRKWQIVVYMTLAGVLGVLFGYSHSVILLETSGFLLATFLNLFSNTYHQYMAEILPTRVRAASDGLQYSLSRLGTFIFLTYLGSVLVTSGPTALYLTTFAFAIIVALDIAALGPKATGERIEVIAK